MKRLLIISILLVLCECVPFDMTNTGGSGTLFEVLFDRFEVLFETPDYSSWNLKVRKINKVRVLTGWVSASEPFGNDVKMELKGLKKQGGEYRYLPYKVPPTGFCDVAKNDPYTYPYFARGSDFPENIGENCPLPAGNYTVYNATSNFEDVPKSIFQSGDYCVEFLFHKNDKVISTYRLYVFINKI